MTLSAFSAQSAAVIDHFNGVGSLVVPGISLGVQPGIAHQAFAVF